MTKKFLAEMIGTMVLVFVGCGAATFNGGATSVQAVLAIAFAFGLSVLAMVYTIGSISGCHINPAITFGVWLSGRMKGSEALIYMIAQVMGSIIGSFVLFAIITTAAPGTIATGTTQTGANGFAEGNQYAAFIAETVFTFIFVLVVLGSTSKISKTPKFAGLAIGLSLVLIHIACIPITGTSVNPARSIGPALFQGGTALTQLWLFIVAPMLGGSLAAVAWKIFEKE